MRSLILTGDDFGGSHAVNEAIERHFETGLLTQASLMVNEPCAEEAVRIARRHPGLAVGLHLTLCDGRASRRSVLTDARQFFDPSPARAGLRYFFDRRLEEALRSEIAAQFHRARELGFADSHFDGHAHLHLHPAVLRFALAESAGFKLVRLVHEPGSCRPLPLIFRALSAAARARLQMRGLRAADRVHGLRDTGRMTTARFARVLEHLPHGLSELYFHPGAEPAALDLPRVRDLLAAREIALTSARRL